MTCRSMHADALLAKVMHRKRPAFIPLYDRFVDYCYRGVEDAPIPKDRKRGWRAFLPLLGQGIIDDLVAGREFFEQVAALAEGPGDHTATGAGHRRLACGSQPHRTGDLGGVNASDGRRTTAPRTATRSSPLEPGRRGSPDVRRRTGRTTGGTCAPDGAAAGWNAVGTVPGIAGLPGWISRQ